jgi:hypothetical protein
MTSTTSTTSKINDPRIGEVIRRQAQRAAEMAADAKLIAELRDMSEKDAAKWLKTIPAVSLDYELTPSN